MDIKNNKWMWILAVVAVVIIFVYMKEKAPLPVKPVETGVDDKGVALKVLAYDLNKQPLGELKTTKKQTTMTGPGATTCTTDSQCEDDNPLTINRCRAGSCALYGIGYIKLESTISILGGGNAPAEITYILGDNIPGTNLYNPALSGYAKSFSLAQGSPPNVQLSDFMNVTKLELGDVTFKLNVVANYKDAQGNAIDISTYGTRILRFASDKCLDGTSEGQCSSVNRGKYCLDGTLVDGATTYNCDCCTSVGGSYPCGWVPQPGNGDVCYDELCGTGAHAGQCIQGTINTFFPLYCELDGAQTNACNRCDNCKNDNYGTPSLGCSQPSDPATCTYTVYTAGLSIALAEK